MTRASASNESDINGKIITNINTGENYGVYKHLE